MDQTSSSTQNFFSRHVSHFGRHSQNFLYIVKMVSACLKPCNARGLARSFPTNHVCPFLVLPVPWWHTLCLFRLFLIRSLTFRVSLFSCSRRVSEVFYYFYYYGNDWLLPTYLLRLSVTMQVINASAPVKFSRLSGWRSWLPTSCLSCSTR